MEKFEGLAVVRASLSPVGRPPKLGSESVAGSVGELAEDRFYGMMSKLG